jgi:hypothetical protein
MVCPGLRVIGKVGPLSENPLPEVWTAVTVSFHERAFVMTSGKVVWDPVATDPNDSAEGLAIADSLLTPVPST